MSAAPAFPIALAQRRAEFEVRRAVENRQNRDDLRQDLLVAAVERWPRYKPSKGAPATFLSTVIRRRRLDIVRDSSTITAGARMQLRTWEEVPESRLIYSPSGREALRMDVRIVVASLPAQLQRLCLALMKFGVSEAARRLGISIGVTKYRIKLIREQFSEAGVTL